MRQLLVPTLILISGLLTACSGAKETLGLNRSVPDEFAVIPSAPLEIPKNFSQLPPPKPGAPRPQEANILRQAERAVIGEKVSDKNLTNAETALLQQAGAEDAEDDIRRQIDRELNENSGSQSVTQKLFGLGGDSPEKNTLDPQKELERLSQQQAAKREE